MLVDIHIHCCRARHPQLTRPNGSAYPTPERLIAMMDAAGITHAVMMSVVNPEFRYTIVTPEETMGIVAQYPDRIIPFFGLDPRFVGNSPDSDFRPLLRAFIAMGCRGIGEYIPNLPFDDPLNLNVFAQVEEVGLPLTFHVGPQAQGCYGCIDEPGLPRLEKVLRAFPRLTFLAHSQPFWAEISADLDPAQRGTYPTGQVVPGRVVELMRAYPNLHGDLSAGSGFNAISRDPEFGYAFLEEFQDRLYFGTDIASDPQDLPIVPYFRRLREEKLVSTEALDKICWRNANRLLGLGLSG